MGKLSKKSRFIYILYITILFVFFYLPIVVTMVYSFNSSKSLTNWTGFSFRWYGQLINDGSVMKAVLVSITVAILATIISTVLGTLTAIGLSKSRRFVREAVLNINNIPIMNPDIVTAIGLMLLFSSLAMPRGYITMLLAHVAFCTPFVITSVYPKARSLDPAIADAALDLGATPFEALTKVIIPMLKDGIYAGILLAFTMSFDDFVISYFVTGNGVQNISIVVYNMTKRTNPTINALSTIVILVIAITLVISRLIPAMMKNTMRKILIAGLFLLIGVAIFAETRGGGRTLRIYNAGEYIDTSLISEFEQAADCKVVYETFDSNESMYTKIKSGAEYDILIPSDYMIERLIKEDLLQPVNWSKVKNGEGLNPSLMGNAFDPENQYAVPYFAGSVGILYDKTLVDQADAAQGWDLLRNTRYKGMVYMYDSERDSFMVALKALGYSMNTTDQAEIEAAYQWLLDQRNTMDIVYVGDEVIDNMISGNKAIAVVYSGDAAYIMQENPNMEYIEPKQGTNIWVDGMVITKSCNDLDLAHAFINYMLDQDIAYRNSSYVGYTSPVLAVADRLKEDEYSGIGAYTPDFEGAGNEVFRYQEPEIKALFADLWTKVKAY